MATYKDFLNRVHHEVVGCPTPIMLSALRDSVITFCVSSTAYQSQAEITLVEGQRDYSLALTEGWYPSRITRAWDEDGNEILPTYQNLHNPEIPSLDGMPQHYWMNPDKTVTFLETPRDTDAGKIVYVRVSIAPSRSSSFTLTLPDWMYEDYEDGIAAGAMSILQRIKNKEWSSKKASDENKKILDREITKARRRILKGYTDKGRTTTPQKFGGFNG